VDTDPASGVELIDDGRARMVRVVLG